ncbi:MAG TPA: ATP-binding protein [Gemmatimonadales bacterium]|nr:ATP-binding protein [Gemmatimonadales bacterium]
MTSDADLVDRLVALPTAEPIPREEWEWLAAHGELVSHEAGWILGPKGERIEHLWIVLSGHVAVSVDRGAGLRRVTEWRTGEVTGRLPYSRMGVSPGNNRLEAPSELLAIDEREFGEMTKQCPKFTAYCVHLMLDRARSFSASELQDEKMVSLGKLAAGLAHEINNPASATVRAAKQLFANLGEVESAARALGAAGATGEMMDAVERVRVVCLAAHGGTVLSPLQQADREDKIATWLARHRVDAALTGPLADTAATVELLDGLAETVSDDALEAAVRWIAAGCATHALAMEIENAATRIADLVAAVKRFTYMDNMAGPEPMDLEPGLRDTIRVMASKARSKGVAVTLDVAPNLPPVRVTGGELNQVWMNLLDNALDAAPKGGSVTVNVRRNLDRLAVRITDDGPGIPADVMARIFDPFFTTKPPGEGTGLGLEITRRLIRRYRGEVTVESRPGRTTFCVQLPVAGPVTDHAPTR